MKRYFIMALISMLSLSVHGSLAQQKLNNGAEFDKMVHNFGDIMLGSGPVTCTYTMTNKGSAAIVIYSVTTTCGCTDATWTREPIKPGEKGEITVTYSNDEGPYPFDKSITVYLSGERKPVILKLRGVANEKQRPLTELYPVHFGPLGFKDLALRCGNLEQGGSKTETVMVANLSSKPINLTFKDVTENLDIRVSENPIPAGETAELAFTVTADRNVWGKNDYYATPLIDGRAYTSNNGDKMLSINAFTKENFSSMTDEQREKGPMPRFDTSTFSFGKVKLGTEINATFTFKNEGKSDFRVYKVDADASHYSHSSIPVTKPGKTANFSVKINTRGMKKGENMTIVTLTTNSPTRPIINLFVSGELE